jgi:localization factor PodJL
MVASLREQMRQMPAAPQRKAPEPSQAFEPEPNAGPDLPLEPGSGRPRGRGEAGSIQPVAVTPPPPAAGSINPNLIAAARRAAMAASAESGALAADQGKAQKGKGQKDGAARTSLPISLRETLEKRRKPILLGLAAIVLAIGAGQVATTLLGDPPQSAQVRPVAAPAQSDPATAPAQAGSERSESSQPATSTPALPPKDQTSMSGDCRPRARDHLIGPVCAGRGCVAATGWRCTGSRAHLRSPGPRDGSGRTRTHAWHARLAQGRAGRRRQRRL